MYDLTMSSDLTESYCILTNLRPYFFFAIVVSVILGGLLILELVLIFQGIFSHFPLRAPCGSDNSPRFNKMAPFSRLEIDLVRLLDRCEAMAHQQQSQKQGLNWRLEKYVCTLQNQITELSKVEGKPNQDTMNDYVKRISFLRGFVETEKKDSLTEKALASQQLARPVSAISATSRAVKSPVEKTQELHIKTKARIQKEMREELLGSKKDPQGLRNRRPGEENTKEKAESIDSVLQYHQNMQEKIADNMVRMAQSLKHTSMMASNIIHQDNKSLETSTRLVDSNFVKLKQESDRIEEITSRRCAIWMWIALAMVVIVFIMTILFIRMFPKKQ